MAKPTMTAVALTVLLALPVVLAAPGNGNGPGNGAGQTKETVDITLNLEGEAIKTDGNSPDTFVFYINATGEGDRVTPNGNGVQIRADRLDAQVVVINEVTGMEVENYTALLKFHASEASYLGQGLEGFRFNMQLTGQRSESVLGNNANPDGRILAMNSHGSTVGEADDDGAFAIEGKGQTTTKTGRDGNDADHYNFQLGGTGSIVAQS